VSGRTCLVSKGTHVASLFAAAPEEFAPFRIPILQQGAAASLSSYVHRRNKFASFNAASPSKET
jgi:hypothetical protein